MIRHALALLLTMPLLFACSSAGDRSLDDQRHVLNEAAESANKLLIDPDLPELPRYVKQARAVLIIPNMYKAGLLVGGEYGRGVLLVKMGNGVDSGITAPVPVKPITVEPLSTDNNGNKTFATPESMGNASAATPAAMPSIISGWGNPVFYKLSGASIGLQIGGQNSETIITIMTQKGLDTLLNNSVKLGADVSVAVGPIGKGVQAATGVARNADMYAFSRAEGLYGGASLSGVAVREDTTWNMLVYGANPRPADIMRRQDTTLPEIDTLRRALSK